MSIVHACYIYFTVCKPGGNKKREKFTMIFCEEKKANLYFLLSLLFPHQEQMQTCKYFAIGLKDSSEILPLQHRKLKLL